jgi:hypothetical protein
LINKGSIIKYYRSQFLAKKVINLFCLPIINKKWRKQKMWQECVQLVTSFMQQPRLTIFVPVASSIDSFYLEKQPIQRFSKTYRRHKVLSKSQKYQLVLNNLNPNKRILLDVLAARRK